MIILRISKVDFLRNFIFRFHFFRISSIILIFLFQFTLVTGQIDLFTEVFDEANGSTSGSSSEGINWSSTCVTCTSGGQFFQTNNGVMDGMNTDGVANWITDPIDISSCITITVSFDYAGDPFPGPGNLESFDECFGGCAGDVNFPSSPGCNNCWDFMAFYVNIDGASNEIGVIGTGINETSYFFEYTSPCLNGAEEATLEVNTQTWAVDENMTFDNVLLVCNTSGAATDLIVASPDADLCEGEDLILSAPPGYNSYSWSGPAGTAFSQNWAINDLALSDAGTYFLTLVDGNGCSINEEIDITVSGGPSAMISGGGNLCIGQCKDIAFAITGGTDPYTVDLEISVDPFSIPFTIPSVELIDTVTICADASGPVPEYDPATNIIHVPQITGITASLILLGITDAAGCEGTVDPTPLELTLVNPPVAQNPGPLDACDSDDNGVEEFDLSQLEAIINGGGNDDVHFYLDMDLSMEIFSPYSSGSTTVFATVENADCASEPVEFNLNVFTAPDIVSIADQNACNEYILLEVEGMNLSGNQAYYTGPGGTGQIFFPGQTITNSQLLYIYDVNGTCSDEEVFIINIFPGPDIFPSGDIVACDFYELAPINGVNLSGDEAYYTGNSGNGVSYLAGDVINTDLTLYMYDGYSDCEDEESFNVVVILSPQLSPLNDTIVCNEFVLPPISGQNLSGGQAYYLSPEGNGPSYQPGELIDFSAIIYIYDSNINCSDETSFNLIVTEGPTLDIVSDTSVCNPFVLQLISGENLTGNEAYFTGPGGSGNIFGSGDTIFTSQLLYIFDGVSGCEDEQSFTVEVGEGLSAGIGSSTVICDGSTINLFDFIDNEDIGGTFADPSGSGGLTDELFDGSGLAGEIFTLIYEVDNGGSCPNDSSFINVEVVTELQAGADTILNLCSGGPIDLIEYLNEGDPGGTFLDIDGTGFLNGSILEVDSLQPGSYEFEYIVGDGLTCAMYSATIEIYFQPAPEFTNVPDTVFTCTFYILPTINGNYLNGSEAYYLDENGNGTAYYPGDSIIQSDTIYLYASSDSCHTEISFYLIVEEPVDAGEDVLINACDGSVVDLEIIIINADSGGVFIDPINTGVLNGTLVNTTGLSGILNFQYIVSGMQCAADTSEISVEIVSEVFAGIDTLSSSCMGQLIDLTELVVSGDVGGIFSEDAISGGLQGNLFNTGLVTEGNYNFWYVVGDGMACPEDSAWIQLNVIEGPIIDPIADTISCFDFIIPVFSGSNLSGNQQFSTLPYGGGIVHNTGDQLLSDQWVYMTDNNGLCLALDSFYVDIVSPQTAGNDVVLSICENNVLNLAFYLDGADLGGQFMDPANTGMLNGNFFSGLGNPGNYLVYYVHASQQVCPSDTAIFSITVQSMQHAGEDVTLNLCEGEVFDLTTSLIDADMGGAFFDISGSGGLNGNLLSTVGLGGQLLNIVYSVGNGGVCMADNANIVVSVTVEPVLNPITDINACDAYVLPEISGVGLNGNEAYFTGPNGQGTQYDPGEFIDSNTSLFVYTGDSTCYDELIFNINIQSLEIITESIQVSCPDDSTGVVLISPIQAGTAPYEVFLNGTSYGNYNVLDIELGSLAAGTYDILILDVNDCAFTGQFTIDESPGIILTAPQIISIEAGESKQILIDLLPSSYDIFWTPDIDISCSDCFNPTFTPGSTTEYFFTITDSNGCTKTRSIIIEVRESESIFIPNVFSPNNDGINDKFFIQTKSDMELSTMIILNRFGEIMFESNTTLSNNPDAGWNGKFKGRELNPGVYTYYLKIRLPSGEHKAYSGALTLVK